MVVTNAKNMIFSNTEQSIGTTRAKGKENLLKREDS